MVKPRNKQKPHEPVLVDEVLEALRLRELALSKKQTHFIDATLGFGGHTLNLVKSGANVLAIEADKKSIEVAQKRLKSVLTRPITSRFGGSETCPTPEVYNELPRGSFKLVYGNFRKIDEIAKNHKFHSVDGILFDLGISSYQLSDSRGFSFGKRQDPLDMRIDPETQAVKASDLLNALDEKKLTLLFEVVLPKPTGLYLAKRIVERRLQKKFESVGDLLEIVGDKKTYHRIHPATLSFLALRIAVNSELENLKESIPRAYELLKKGGRLVVISFHSAEDSIVKKFFREYQDKDMAKIISKKPIVPTKNEIFANPRARSAKMRVLEKIW